MKGVGYCSDCAQIQYGNYDIYKKIGAIEPPTDESGQVIETPQTKISMVMDHTVLLAHNPRVWQEQFDFFTLGFGQQAGRSNNVQLCNDVMYLIASHLNNATHDYSAPEHSNYRVRLNKAMGGRKPVPGVQACMLCCRSDVGQPGFQHIVHPEGIDMCDDCEFAAAKQVIPKYEVVPPDHQDYGFPWGLTEATLRVMKQMDSKAEERILRKRRYDGSGYNTRLQHKKRLRLWC